MNMNGKLVKTLLIVIVLLVAGGIGWYMFKKENANPVSGLKPRVEMGIGQINNITDSTLDMDLKVLVHNPLPVGMDIKNFSYVVQMNGKTIMEDDYPKPVNIKSNDSTVIPVTSELKISKLRIEGDKEASKGEDSADYHFEGVFHLQKPFLGKDSIELSMDKRLPLVRVPKIKMAGYDMKKLRLKDTEVVLKIELTNPNPFSMEFRNASYVMDLGKQKRIAEGSVKGTTKIKAHSKEIYEIPMSIDLGKMLKATGQVITKGKNLPYTFYFKGKIVSENDMFKNSNINMITNGELEDMKMAKENLIKK
jgi:LEA14-like dessication related protein